MQITSLALRECELAVTWSDGSRTDYPYLFLRDNDPTGFHPQTQERLFDLLSVPETVRARSARLEPGSLSIDWADLDGPPTVIPVDWLVRHRPGRRAADPAEVGTATWGVDLAPRVPRVAAADILNDDGALARWLVTTKRHGLSIVDGLADDEDAAIQIGERIGFLRRTNFGVTFRVETIPDPNNLAYTADALALHTDLPNQELPPGFQFLHCVANGASGGESILADGYRIAERVRERDAAAFALLASVPVPYRFHDRDVDIRIHRPVIGLDERGRVFDIRYSAHIMDAFDMPAETMGAYYRAFRLFMAETRDRANVVQFRLMPGEMMVFDNRRVLHGRTGFDPSSGHRLLRGFYVDRGEFDSRIRMLSVGAGGRMET